MGYNIGSTEIIDDNRVLKNYRANSVIISANTSAIAGCIYVANNNLTLSLPSSPTAGDMIGFSNQSGNTKCIIAANGSNINGITQDLKVDIKNASFYLQYTNSSRGWIIF